MMPLLRTCHLRGNSKCGAISSTSSLIYFMAELEAPRSISNLASGRRSGTTLERSLFQRLKPDIPIKRSVCRVCLERRLNHVIDELGVEDPWLRPHP